MMKKLTSFLITAAIVGLSNLPLMAVGATQAAPMNTGHAAAAKHATLAEKPAGAPGKHAVAKHASKKHVSKVHASRHTAG